MDTLRLSDADREAATGLLSEQYAVGRLNKDEFDERSDAVWSAKTRGDLAPVFADLPVRSPALPVRVERRRSRDLRAGGVVLSDPAPLGRPSVPRLGGQRFRLRTWLLAGARPGVPQLIR